MDIWLINHYAVPPQYYPLARQYNFAKCLMARGHSVKIFAASTVHNSDKNLITDGVKYREKTIDDIQYVFIRCKGYSGNGLKRIYNMIEFALKLPGVCGKFKKPDAIVSTSVPPMSCAMGVRLAKKYGCKSVAEIADLWPESIVAYGIAGERNPAVLALRRLEKWIYTKADAVVFTVKGAYDYVLEQHWETVIPKGKVFYINNGILQEQFDDNKKYHVTEDIDLDNHDNINFVYVGSIRRANNLDLILDTAKLVQNSRIRFLIWGAGDKLEQLVKRVEAEGIHNVIFKGKVDKTFVPGIVTKAYANFFLLEDSPLYRFGISANKSFDYLASGRPMLIIGKAKYTLVQEHACGVQISDYDAHAIAKTIDDMAVLSGKDYEIYCLNSCEAAKEYDFNVLTDRLIEIINKI